MKVARRRVDGALFRASYPPDWGDGDAIADTLKPGHRFYFIGIEYVPRPWWKFWQPRWRDRDEVWQLDVERIPAGLFDVISAEEAGHD
jgi:hypothetical protein